jgi:GT2 family glycosyltransferase
MDISFSLVVPVYNRPEELRELLFSLQGQTFDEPYEVVVVEDGSTRDASTVVEAFRSTLELTYWKKENTGPGDSRNFGMRKARGNYFVLVDSDCILPPEYFSRLKKALEEDYADCVGGPDRDHPSFTSLQKAISFSMTSPLTTGGIRGGKRPNRDFQPRSFNMGLSQAAFQASGGFGDIHPGEDPDLSLRLKTLGFSSRYLPEVFVFHKRRTDFSAFFRQVYRFGLARPILNRWHPQSARPVYWLPLIFLLGLLLALGLPVVWDSNLAYLPMALYLIYLTTLAISAVSRTGKFDVGLLTILAVLVQFTGYGLGFLKSATLLTFSKRKPQHLFPNMFFNS